MSARVLRATRFREDFAAVVNRREAPAGTSTRFVEAVAAAVDLIGRFPEAGSTHLAEFAAMPGLRTTAVPGFPYLILSLRDDDTVRLIRLLHERRNLPAAVES